LEIHSCSHGKMIGEMIKNIEILLQIEKPDIVLLYGDTNSTLAGAISASKIHIPIAHVEAGLRSYDKKMPEEINRILTDHVSSLLFCPTKQAVKNLLKEGFDINNIKLVGDVMYDLFLKYKNKCKNRNILNTMPSKNYCLMTIHREENATEEKIKEILSMVQDVCDKFNLNFVFPIHPRTLKFVKHKLDYPKIIFISPVSYMDMLSLELNAKLIVTDSGGIQKEACWSKVSCITIRNSTEWIETIENRWNILTGINKIKFEKAVYNFLVNNYERKIPDYGNGESSEKIINEIVKGTIS